jgi:hypothetical protein
MLTSELGSTFPVEGGPYERARMSRTFFESVTLGALGVMIAVGILFWFVGERSRRRGLVGTVVAGEDSQSARQ